MGAFGGGGWGWTASGRDIFGTMKQQGGNLCGRGHGRASSMPPFTEYFTSPSPAKSAIRRAMVYDYDKLYGETPDALGEPTPQFIGFFDRLEREDLRVLDVGCGQGRDALFIARLGHRVVGVDISENGIRDLSAAAGRENLAVEGVVADITAYRPEGVFDVILVDRTLHMLPKVPRLSVLDSLLDHVDVDGWVLIADEVSNISDFQGVFSRHHFDWKHVFSKQGYLFVRRS